MLAPAHVLGAFDRLVDVFDEPLADQAALPTMLLAEQARKDVTVVLTGEGADEVFGGYVNYRRRARDERWMRWLSNRGSPVPPLVRAMPATWRQHRLLRALGEPLSRRYRTIPNLFDALLQPGLLAPALLEATRGAPDVAALAKRAFEECNSPHYLDRLMHIDLRLWLPDDLLAKVDRATMAYSLEARVPYLDHQLVEFCARLDAGQKIRGPTHKFLLKRVARRYLPASTVDRDKQGFVLPLTEWLMGPLSRELDTHLLEGGLAGRGIFRDGALARILAEFRSGRRNHVGRLWSLLVLERWFRRYVPGWRMA
jgi:asparagine synthase (glutamine-hydrolysing)